MPTFPGAKAALNAVKRRFAQGNCMGSDHLLCLEAFRQWKQAKHGHKERDWCSKVFLSNSTMNTVAGMREQVAAELQRLGFISSINAASREGHNLVLVRAVMVCG